MPKFWRSLFGPRVMTNGHVMSGAASPGQQVWMGNWLKSTASPSSTTCWQGAFLTTFGPMLSTCLKMGNFSHASFMPFGGSGSFKYASNSPTLRNAVTSLLPMPMATLSGVPNRLANTGILWPIGFSNNSAGPPARSVRSHISVISRIGSTGWVMRLSCPCFSSWLMKSRKSLYFIGFFSKYNKGSRGCLKITNLLNLNPSWLRKTLHWS